jgi:hypothetical protein
MTIVPFERTIFDTHAHWSPSGDRTKVLIRRNGYYEIIGWAQWGAGDGTRGVGVRKNGAERVTESRGLVEATQAMLSTIAIEKLESGDWLQLELYCLGAYPIDPSDQHSLTVVRLA